MLLGVDFTSAPTRRKPITLARGQLQGTVVRVERIDLCSDFAAFESALAAPGPWLGAFDFPFGLPREFVATLQLGDSIDTVIHALQRRCADRMAFRALVDAWGNARPAGRRLILRATDGAMPGITSSSPLQTRYVPVGFMLFEGLSRLVRAGVTIPQMRVGDPLRVALEGYPGLLTHELIGRRSYKDRNELDQLNARKDIVEELEQGRTRLGLRLKLTHADRNSLVDDASGDRLDAVLCLIQAAWASARTGCGLPASIDPVEGWIVTA
jgi:hypothetical protein